MNENEPPVIPYNPEQPQRPVPQKKGRGWMWFSFFLLFCMLCGGGGFFMLVGIIGAAAGDLETNPTYDKQTVRNNGSKNDLALIDLNGMIASFAVDANGHNQVQSLKRQFKWANNDASVEAILFRINSPGGEVLASDEIADIVRESDKPVIAVMGAVAASGGYYVAAPADWIVAHELTITGSIGVIMSGYSLRNLMDKAGVQPIVFKSGKNKDMLSICLLYTSPSPRDKRQSRMPSSA